MYAVLFTIMVVTISDSSAKENVRFDIGRYGTLYRLSLFVLLAVFVSASE
jgi:hypothetical protein